MQKESRSDSIRRARSLNDIVSIICSLDRSISMVRKNVSVSASPKSVLIDHTGDSDKTPVPNSGAKLTGFKAPDIATVTKHSKTLHLLHESTSDIDAIIASLEHTFAHAKSRDAALNAALKVQKETHKAYGEVASALNAIALNHVPETLTTFAETIQEQLIDLLDSSNYSDIALELYVNANDAVKLDTGRKVVPLEFCYYVVIHDLVLDDDSDKSQPISEYCLMLTGVVIGNTIRYYLNAVPEFLPPGKYPVGKEVKDVKEMTQRLKLLLSIHKIAGTVEHRPMIHTKDSAKVGAIKKFPNVESVDVVDDALVINMLPEHGSDADCQVVISKVIPILTPIMGSRKSSPTRAMYEIVHVKAKTVKRVKQPAYTSIRFTLVGRSSKVSNVSATKHQLDDLKHALDLSDAETSEIKKILITHRG